MINLNAVTFTQSEGRFTAFAMTLSDGLGVTVDRVTQADAYSIDIKVSQPLSTAQIMKILLTPIVLGETAYTCARITPGSFNGNAYNALEFDAVKAD
jgi:hypothetical protein